MLNDVCGIWEDWCINEKINRLFPHVCISSFFAPMTKVLCLPRFVPTVNSSHSSKWVWLFWASQLAMDAWLALCVYVDFFQKQTADENLWTANLSSFFIFIRAFISPSQVTGIGLLSCHSQSTMTWLQLMSDPAARLVTNTLAGPTSPHGCPIFIGSHWSGIWFQSLFHFTHGTMVRGWHCFKWNTESSRGLMDEVQAEKSPQMNVFIYDLLPRGKVLLPD